MVPVSGHGHLLFLGWSPMILGSLTCYIFKLTRKWFFSSVDMLAHTSTRIRFGGSVVLCFSSSCCCCSFKLLRSQWTKRMCTLWLPRTYLCLFLSTQKECLFNNLKWNSFLKKIGRRDGGSLAGAPRLVARTLVQFVALSRQFQGIQNPLLSMQTRHVYTCQNSHITT